MNITNVKEMTKSNAEFTLLSKGHKVTVLWDTAYTSCSKNTRVFVRCNVCENSKDLQVSNLCIGKYKCEHCLLTKYSNACNEMNLKLINKMYEKDQLKILVECKICGEKCSASPGHIQNSNFKCNGCLLAKYKTACEALNLIFLEKITINRFTKLITRCKTCNHETLPSSSSILKGSFKCNNCAINKYKTSLVRKNCNFVSFEKRYKQKSIVHYINSDGDSFSASASNVLEGKFETSSNGYWSQKHSVYLIKLRVDCNTNIYKIGTANDPNKRAKDLKLNKDHQVFTLASFETRYEADKLESELHREFSDNRLCSHSVSKHTDGYVSRKRSDGKYHRVKDGITEWFSSEVYETLKVRYNLT